MNLRNKHSRGFSMVELMVGSTIFVVVALSIAGVHQKLARDASVNHLSQKSLEYMQSEIDQLNRLVRVPERNIGGDLVYRDSSGVVVSSGGSLVPYGYNNLIVIGTNALHAEKKEVVYPDVLNSFSNVDATADRIKLNRKYSVQVFNQNQPDEFKQVTVTISDSASPERYLPVSQTIILKKPDPRALDIRIAKGTASLAGNVKDKASGAVPTTPVTVTLIPGDGTASRITNTDSAGNFFFQPPINPSITYNVQFQSAGNYWTRVIPVTLTPGANMILGDSPGVVLLSPIVYAKASVVVRSGDTGAPLANANIIVNHSGAVPNSGSTSYTKTTDVNGQALFNIQIPMPDVTHYDLYYLGNIAVSGHLQVQNPSDRFLRLDQFAEVRRTYELYTVKKGSLQASVINSAGSGNSVARVNVYSSSNYTGLADQGNTDVSGQVTLGNLSVNTIAAPTQTIRKFYVRVQSPLHLLYSLTTTPIVNIAANDTAVQTYEMLPHKMEWANTVTSTGVTVGYSTTLQAQLFYHGHQGPKINDAALGPNPAAFLGQSVTSGGFPAAFNWSGWDNEIITVSDGPTVDTKVIRGVKPGVTQINVTGTYSFSWNSVPQTLTASRNYTITCLASGSLLTVTMLPNMSIVSPNIYQTFSANASTLPSDLTYTWSVTGAGVAGFTTVNSAGSAVSNGSEYATHCKVLTSPTLLTQFTIQVALNSASIAQSAVATKVLTVDYIPLAVTMSPPGPLYTQPGYNTDLQAMVVGGSGNYSIAWSLRNPATGDPLTGLGTLSTTLGAQSWFSASQIGSVNATATVTDTNSGRSVEGAVLINVQPSGGVTGDDAP